MQKDTGVVKIQSAKTGTQKLLVNARVVMFLSRGTLHIVKVNKIFSEYLFGIPLRNVLLRKWLKMNYIIRFFFMIVVPFNVKFANTLTNKVVRKSVELFRCLTVHWQLYCQALISLIAAFLAVGNVLRMDTFFH